MQKVDGVEIDYGRLPENHRQTMRFYIESGLPPGSGFTAIICNDLRACVMVDEDTFAALPAIYRWMVNHAPSMAWGSQEKMEAWMSARRREQDAR